MSSFMAVSWLEALKKNKPKTFFGVIGENECGYTLIFPGYFENIESCYAAIAELIEHKQDPKRDGVSFYAAKLEFKELIKLI